MRIFVDGYNVIFAPSAHEFDTETSENARQQLISLLLAYRHITGDAITVVFDGHPEGRMYPQTENVHGITVIFSEADADADAVLKRLVAREANPNGVTVVSSDNSLRVFAERLGAKCLDSLKFLKRVDRTLRSAHSPRPDGEPLEKYEGLSPGEVAYWMKVLGLEKGKK